MFEELTYEYLLERMLERAKARGEENPNEAVDTSEGSITYSILAPIAWELAEAYISISTTYDNTFADTAPREELILRAKERGLEPKKATQATLKGEFNIDIPIGSRFSLDELNYICTKQIETGIYELQCETSGTAGNRKLGELTPIEYIDGLESAELTELLIPGTDNEDTEDFRARYFGSFNLQAFGGNRADYLAKVKDIDGVGACKTYRAATDNPNVTVVILNSQYAVPSATLVNLVQQTIDPTKDGAGDGLAPICHVVNVLGATSMTINITFNLTLDTGYTYADVQDKAKEVIDKYFLELAEDWENTDNLIVRIARIESNILTIAGVLDITATALNGVESNITLDGNSIPVRGDINANP